MRLSLTLSLALALVVVAALGGAVGRASIRPVPLASPAVAAAIRDYRRLASTYEQIVPVRRTTASARTSAAKLSPGAILARWQLRADVVRRSALSALRRRLGIRLPAGPGPRAPVSRLLAYSQRLTRMLERIFPEPSRASRSLSSARRTVPLLSVWQLRAATVALAVARHAPHPLFVRDRLTASLMCIHRYEGTWTANTGNGYYGGLQMDLGFQHTYAQSFVERWGTADNWPVWAQVAVARRAYRAGRGFAPWPHTRRLCGL